MHKTLIFIALIIGLFMSVPITLHAEEIGEYCWRDTETIIEADTCTLRLQITQHGNYYALNGKETCAYDEAYSVFGSGYIDGNLVKMGLTYINREEIAHHRVEIDLSDGLNGLWYDTSEGDVDPLYFMQCP